jgi:hypothetical protein
MLKDIFVADNVFSYPDEVVKWANLQKFYENKTEELEPKKRTYWQGNRTLNLSCGENKEKNNILMNDVLNACFLDQYNNFSYKFSWAGSMFFHRLDKNCIFNNKWVHTDPKCLYAGVVYLNKDPPVNSGTMVYLENDKIEYVENKYNRLIMYKSKLEHSPVCGFGEGETSRLTFTMFLSKIDITIKSEDTVYKLA